MRSNFSEIFFLFFCIQGKISKNSVINLVSKLEFTGAHQGGRGGMYVCTPSGVPLFAVNLAEFRSVGTDNCPINVNF